MPGTTLLSSAICHRNPLTNICSSDSVSPFYRQVNWGSEMGRNMPTGSRQEEAEWESEFRTFWLHGQLLTSTLETIGNYPKESNLLFRPTNQTTATLKFKLELEKNNTEVQKIDQIKQYCKKCQREALRHQTSSFNTLVPCFNSEVRQ